MIALQLLNPPKKNTEVTEENKNTVNITKGVSQLIPTTVLVKNFDFHYGKAVTTIPTLAPQEGEGVDVNSPIVQSSISEIEKIKVKLPYKKTIRTDDGKEIDIVIPSQDIMDNNWTLLVNVNNIDFQIDESDKDYDATKTAFLIGAQDVYYWLKSQGVNTEKIIIQWGDRATAQSRATAWLN